MAVILNIETATTICSVCIARNGVVLDSRQSTEANAHARQLTVLIRDVLSATTISMQEIDAVAVSAGPGSYTGLRIGLSVAKGLCFALKKPLISVSTLHSLSEAIKDRAPQKQFYMPVLDARRMDIYTAVYDHSGKEVFTTTSLTVNESVAQKINSLGDVWIGGNATQKMKPLFHLPNLHFVDNVDCNSVWMATTAQKKFDLSDFEDLAYFEPNYLKPFQTTNSALSA